MNLLQLFKKCLTGAVRNASAQHVPLRLEQLESRLVPYSVSGNAWPHPELITLSFVPDGTVVGQNGSGNITSNLFSTFNTRFGSAAAWQNVILKAAQTWAQVTNINFTVVSDNGGSIGSGGYQQGDPGFGDIRIGAYNFGNTSTLASTYLPPPVNNYSLAGDMQFNTAVTWNTNGAMYDLYTVAVHELGHALGLYHSSTITANMYSAYRGAKSALATDDVNGIESIYGGSNSTRSADSYDAVASNNTLATASNITSLVDPNALTAQVAYADLASTSDVDWYAVTAPANTTGTLTVNVQSAGLSLLTPSLTVYAADQITVLGTASVTGYQGGTATVTVTGVTPGAQYYLKVAGVDSTAFSTGRYALTLNFGNGAMPDAPIPNTQVAEGSPHTSGGGQPIKLSLETRVNTYTTGTQQANDGASQGVALDSYGDYVVVWSSNGEDGGGWGVYGQRYNSLGVALGGEFRVNTTTAGDQEQAVVAMDSVGDFVVVWASNGQDGSGSGVYGQRYNSLGVAQGGEFRVNTTTANDQDWPSVAMDAAGDFVVVWESKGQDAGASLGVYGQRYNSLGVAQGGEFRVNTTTANDQASPCVAMDGSGNFVVVWESNGQDGGGWGVYGQRYNASGAAQGGEFRVNNTTAGDQRYPAVAMNAAGVFVVTWSSNGQDGGGWGVYAQRYNASGAPQSSEFRVNTTTAGDQKFSAVDLDGSGNFIVTWQSYNQDAANTWGIYAQQFDPNGNKVGTEFLVNTTTAGDQQWPAIVMNSGGTLVIVWSGNAPGDSSGVALQRYMLGILNGISSNESAYDQFDPNEGVAEEQARQGAEQLAALEALMREATPPAWNATGTTMSPALFSLSPIPDGLALHLPMNQARVGLPKPSNHAAPSSRVSSDDVFTDSDWLDKGPDTWRLDDPAVTPQSTPVEITEAALAATPATEGSGDGE
jgi:hypothetical protein